MHRHRIHRATYFKIAASALLAVLLLSVGFLLMRRWEDGKAAGPVVDPEKSTVTVGGKKYERKENIETFLVLGLDKNTEASVVDSYNNDKQADFLMLFVLDHDAKTYSAISINRDTMTDVNVLGVAGNRIDTVKRQIALAHTYGNGREVSCRNTADAVSALLHGTRVNHYLSVTMDAVPLYTDLIGGVELEILDDFSGIEDRLVKGQTVTLDGELAMTYIRTRSGLDDNTNIARMERQLQFVEAVRSRSVALLQSDESFAIRAVTQMADYFVSDRSVTQLQDLSARFSDYDFGKIYEIEGESEVGEHFMEFYADDEAVWEMLLELFYVPIDQ